MKRLDNYINPFATVRLAAMGVLVLAMLSPARRGGDALGAERPLPTRAGLALSAGHIYDPNADRDQFALLTGILEMDHDRAAFFPTPDCLRFKLEATVGSGRRAPWRSMVAVNMLSLCYIDRLATDTLRPYIEGGIGIIYMERRWEGQAFHFLNNPVAGAGVQFSPRDGARTYQVSLRLFHASNGRLHRRNKAMNAVLLSTGVLF